MEAYGTDAYWLEKSGQAPSFSLRDAVLLRGGAAATWMGLAAADKAHREELLQQAEMMNQMFRAEQSRRMAPVHMSLTGKTASALSSELTEVAENVGRSLAHQDFEKLGELEKEALFRALLSKGLGMAGKMLGKGGKALGGGAGQAMRRGGAKMRAAGLGRKAAPAPMGLSKATRQGFTKGAPTATGSPWAAKGTQELAQSRAGQAALQKAKTAPAAAAAGAGAKKKPFKLMGTGTKLKLLGAGALGAAGLGTAAAARTARDYLMMPSAYGSRWGAHGPAPPPGVSSYGYVTPYT